MANDRMLLRCDVCGECISIANHFQRPWRMYYENMEEVMDKFFARHYSCQMCAYHELEKNGITESDDGEFIEPQHLYSLVFEANPGEGLDDGKSFHWIHTEEMDSLGCPEDIYRSPYKSAD